MPKTPTKNRATLTIAVLLLTATAIIADGVTAGVLRTTPNLQTKGVWIVAGPDCVNNSNTYPSATVSVSASNDYAAVHLSLFPATCENIQPITCYTDLIRIENRDSICHTIKRLTVTDLTGADNLGEITIYYLQNQTDDPASSIVIGSATINQDSYAPIIVYSGNPNHQIPIGGIEYIEIIGYASSNARAEATISFNINLET